MPSPDKGLEKVDANEVCPSLISIPERIDQ
jgi:hypothetical protein